MLAAGALPGAAAAAGQVESAGRRRYHIDQYVINNHRPHMCCRGVRCLALSVAAYKYGPWCRGWAGGGGSWGALVGGDVEVWSAGLSGDALLQLPEIRTMTVLQCFPLIHAFISFHEPLQFSIVVH